MHSPANWPWGGLACLSSGLIWIHGVPNEFWSWGNVHSFIYLSIYLSDDRFTKPFMAGFTAHTSDMLTYSFISVLPFMKMQGMACRANTHRPSFRVSMTGLDKRTRRSNPAQFPCGLDAEMMSEDEDDFELWFQQALASGVFSETSQRRKSWSPFKISQKNGVIKQLRRFS